MSFTNKVIVITGAASGIGAAAAISFAKEGGNVAIADINEVKLNDVAAECAKIGKKPLIIKADVCKAIEAKAIITQVVDVYGKLDVLVNNAGILRVGTILSGGIMDSLDEVLSTNLRAVIFMTTLAAGYLVKTKGNIINISSICSKTIKTDKFTAYSVAKAGVDQFTRCAAYEFASSGVRVNSVNPGGVRTNIYENAKLPNSWEQVRAITPLQKISDPQEIADLILYLASDKARSITGANYVIDNGLLIT